MSNMPSHCLSKFASGSSRESYLRALRGSCAKLQVERAASFATRLGSVDHVDRTDAWDCEVHSPDPQTPTWLRKTLLVQPAALRMTLLEHVDNFPWMSLTRTWINSERACSTLRRQRRI